MRLSLLLLVFTIFSVAHVQAEQKINRASDYSTLRFVEYETYLDDIDMNVWLKCRKRTGPGAGDVFDKKVKIKDSQISGNPEVYGEARYVTGQFRYKGRVDRVRGTGKVSFTGKLTGGASYVQTFTKLNFGQYSCYNLNKFYLED